MRVVIDDQDGRSRVVTGETLQVLFPEGTARVEVYEPAGLALAVVGPVAVTVTR